MPQRPQRVYFSRQESHSFLRNRDTTAAEFLSEGIDKLCLKLCMKIKSKGFVQQLPSQALFQRKTCRLWCFLAHLI